MLVAGIGGQYSDLVFTAPASGTYSIAGSFRGDQYGIGTAVGIASNGNVLFNSSVTKEGQTVPFDIAVTLAAGGTVVFSAGPDGGLQNTGLSLTITPMVNSASAQFTIARTTPTVTATDPGGTYNGSPFPASVTVNGTASLEGVHADRGVLCGRPHGRADRRPHRCRARRSRRARTRWWPASPAGRITPRPASAQCTFRSPGASTAITVASHGHLRRNDQPDRDAAVKRRRSARQDDHLGLHGKSVGERRPPIPAELQCSPA